MFTLNKLISICTIVVGDCDWFDLIRRRTVRSARCRNCRLRISVVTYRLSTVEPSQIVYWPNARRQRAAHWSECTFPTPVPHPSSLDWETQNPIDSNCSVLPVWTQHRRCQTKTRHQKQAQFSTFPLSITRPTEPNRILWKNSSEDKSMRKFDYSKCYCDGCGKW